MKKPTRPIILLVAAALASALAWAMLRFADRQAARPDAAPAKIIAVGGKTMGGGWSVKVTKLPAGKTRQQLQDGVAALLLRLDEELSNYREDSAISRFNRSRGPEWFDVPAEVAEVMAEALRASDETHGAFDVTVGPLVELWGFGPGSGAKERRIPSDDQIAEARKHVGWQLVECRTEPPALRKLDPMVSLDLGGIGKGFAADKVGQYLASVGVQDYLIAIGGELRALGGAPRPGQPGWRVGIETPAADVRRVLRTLELRDASLSTSGDYRNFLLIEGRWFCHEIDLRTGWAMERGHGPAAVSVIDPSGARADALATALIVLGQTDGHDLAERLGAAAMFVSRGQAKFEVKGTKAFDQIGGAK